MDIDDRLWKPMDINEHQRTSTNINEHQQAPMNTNTTHLPSFIINDINDPSGMHIVSAIGANRLKAPGISGTIAGRLPRPVPSLRLPPILQPVLAWGREARCMEARRACMRTWFGIVLHRSSARASCQQSSRSTNPMASMQQPASSR